MIQLKIKSLIFSLVVVLAVKSAFSQDQIEWKDYPGQLEEKHKDKVKYGHLITPEDHSQPEGSKIKVAFCLLKGKSENKEDAVIYLPGGPGGSVTYAVEILLNLNPIQEILEHKDIILFDPRGCGNSIPSLCENLDELEIKYPTIFGKSNEEIEALVINAIMACKDSLDSKGIDPTAYSSVSVAHDVEMLRKTLGYKKWILRGHSYGSYYSQVLIHHFPETVKTAILSGLVPKGIHSDLDEFNDIVRSLKLTFESCQNDSLCNQKYPDLQERFMSVLQHLNENPVIIKGVSKTPIVLNAHVFISAAWRISYSKDGLEILPLLIESVEQGKDWVFNGMAHSLLLFPIENDMLQIIKLNDKTFIHENQKEFSDDFSAKLYGYFFTESVNNINKIYTDLLGIKAQPFDTTQKIYSTPVLLFDGLYDPITPPEHTMQVANYFPNHIMFTVPDRAHDASSSLHLIIPQYIINPGQQPDLSELEALEGLQFPKDVVYNKGVSLLTASIISNEYMTIAIILGAIALLVIGFFYFPVRFLIRKIRKKQTSLPASTSLAIWLVNFLSIGFLILLAIAVMKTMSINDFLTIFGLSGQWSYIFIIPWLIAATLIVCLILSKQVFQKSIGVKIFWSISWLGGFGMIMFLWINGFIWQ